jgi:hypothetical protein
MQGCNQSQEQMLETIQHFCKIATAFSKAISDVIYETNHCPVCKQHYSAHMPTCAWVSFQAQRAAGNFSAWSGDDDQGDGIGFAEAHGW